MSLKKKPSENILCKERGKTLYNDIPDIVKFKPLQD